MIFWAQILSALATVIVAILTLAQSWLNRQTLKEMKISRTQSVSPLLFPELGARDKGAFDQEVSYIFDIKVEVDLSPNLDNNKKIVIPFDITLLNSGKGSAYNVEIIKINKTPVSRAEKKISIIRPDEYKQIQFQISTSTSINEKNAIYITYENMFGEKYKQHFDFEVNQAVFDVSNVTFNKPNKK